MPSAGEPPSRFVNGAGEPAREQRIAIRVQADAERARDLALRLAVSIGLNREAGGCVAMATMELATNLVRYGQHGTILLDSAPGEHGLGVRIESVDQGPGIADLDQALADGFSTGGGMGSGLPAVRRLMDSFTITSSPNGTRVVACKWPATH